MAAPTILNSTDVGAPALSGEDGKMYDVLKWALPLLGWTIEFDDAVNFRIVFRNSTALGGTGTYLRVVDKNADHGYTALVAQYNAYQSMSDIDTGVFQTPASGNCFLPKARALDATARRYKIWGDAYRFLIAVWTDTNVNDAIINAMFCGDLVTIDPLDGCFVIRGGGAASTTYSGSMSTYPYLIASSTQSLWAVTDRAGSAGGVGAVLYGLTPSTVSSLPTTGVTGDLVDPTSGDVKFSRWLIQSGGVAVEGVRGYFPGLWLPLGNWIGGYGNFVSVPDCETPDGTRALQLLAVTRSLNSSAGTYGILIDETDGWGVV